MMSPVASDATVLDDERCVPRNSALNNYHMTREVLLVRSSRFTKRQNGTGFGTSRGSDHHSIVDGRRRRCCRGRRDMHAARTGRGPGSGGGLALAKLHTNKPRAPDRRVHCRSSERAWRP